MSAARDLAGAIYDELVADHTVAAVLDLWQHRHVGASDIDDMRKVLAFVAAYAIEAVLARGESEAARTGPWGRGECRIIADTDGELYCTAHKSLLCARGEP